MTRFLSIDDVLALHDSEIPTALISFDRLASAVGQPSQGFGEEYLYPTVLLQAAVLIRGISQAQAFLDGNKRTAWLCGATFLRNNGVIIERVPDAEALRLLNRLATGDANVADLALWLASHS